MKKKIVLAAILAAMSMSVMACGNKNAETTTATEVATNSDTVATDGDIEVSEELVEDSWGIFNFKHPADFTIRTGDTFDDKDESVCALKKSDFSYFEFQNDSKDTAMQQYNYAHDNYTMEQIDIKASYGDYEWTGFQYSDGMGGYGFEVYLEAKDSVIRVSSVGYAFTDAMTETILRNLTINAEIPEKEVVVVSTEAPNAGESTEEDKDSKTEKSSTTEEVDDTTEETTAEETTTETK